MERQSSGITDSGAFVRQGLYTLFDLLGVSVVCLLIIRFSLV